MATHRPPELRASSRTSGLGGCNFVREQFLESFEDFLAAAIVKEGVGYTPRW